MINTRQKKIEGFSAFEGYEAIVGVLKQAVDGREHAVITIETYTQVDQDVDYRIGSFRLLNDNIF